MAISSLLALILPLVITFGILAVAIYEHVASLSLSLPIAPTLTAFTIALPVAAIANAIYLILSRQRRSQTSRTKSLLWTSVQYGSVQLPSLPVVLQFLQGIITVATAAILIVNNIAGGSPSSSSPSPTLRCALETTWQQLYSAHDAAALRRIQDALNCCGFNSVVDRAWPFPHGSGSTTCAQSYGRTTACRVPWMQTVQRRAGVDLAVVVVVALFQVLTLVVREWPASSFSYHPHGSGEQQGVRRPLLEDRVAEAYTDDVDDVDGTDEAREDANNHQDSNGPRLEPSGLQNAWSTD
ncbi:tetraspanin tsp3 [Grosmannia clavigera kw1407]|uniref:Tetraspanin tsp3 n=1 Tax=Grosmannia clavigera (strain kw1407 / UAMH 11150) TaxID=655863 RepID=F0X716_GROCL|nr:tetraspanin tsp3 [Grosmannia clavigera kw1407]EFX06396.1 tetraspanin tsp3 [Grosmannia clavigera kw1407]